MTADQTERTKKVFVTGASGYLGQKLARALATNGTTVFGVGRSTIAETALLESALRYDRTATPAAVMDRIEAIQPHLVYNLAGQYVASHTSAQFLELMEANIMLPAAVLEACSRAGCRRIVLAGSVAPHADNRDYNPTSLYAAQRRCVDDLAQFYSRQPDTRIVNLKLFETFGDDDDRPKLLNRLVAASITGSTIALSCPWQELELVHVRDAIQAFVDCGTLTESLPPGFHALRLSAATPLTLGDLVQEIEAVLGARLQVTWGDMSPQGAHPLWSGDPAFSPAPPLNRTELRTAITHIARRVKR